MLLFSVGKGAMNSPQYWQRRKERSAMLETAQKTSSGPSQYSTVRYNLPMKIEGDWGGVRTGVSTKKMGNLSSALKKLTHITKWHQSQ
jgi:hypothetical protein